MQNCTIIFTNSPFVFVVDTDGSRQIYPNELNQRTFEALVAESNLVLLFRFYFLYCEEYIQLRCCIVLRAGLSSIALANADCFEDVNFFK